MLPAGRVMQVGRAWWPVATGRPGERRRPPARAAAAAAAPWCCRH